LVNNKGQIEGLPKNPRFCKDHKFVQLKQSIKEDPEMLELREVIAVDYNGELVVIAGNMRLNACLELGIKEVPCKILPQDTPIDKLKAITIKDNVGFGEHDWDALANDWDVEELAHWGLDLPLDFEDEALEVDAVEDDYEMPEQIETDIVLGDLFEIGEHRLLCGDSTDSDAVARLMNGELADMCHTDPPYNIDYEGGSKKREKIANDKLDDFPKFLYDVYTTISTALKKGGAIYVWHASSETHNFIQQFLNAGFLFKSYIVWNKNNSTFGRSDYHWKHEPCIYGWLDGASHKWYGDRKQTTVWDIERPSRSDEHPTMKPIPLCSKPLENSSKQGDVVLDVFLGSGSTMVASHQLKRKCYGMELDPKYCQVIIDRMKKLDPTIVIKRNGQPYEQSI
jgi:site-specific DNA-methyltransferase (adenine-specific)